MRDDGLAALEMAEIAASSDPLPRRGGRHSPYCAGWSRSTRRLALVDPRHPDYTTLADADPSRPSSPVPPTPASSSWPARRAPSLRRVPRICPSRPKTCGAGPSA